MVLGSTNQRGSRSTNSTAAGLILGRFTQPQNEGFWMLLSHSIVIDANDYFEEWR